MPVAAVGFVVFRLRGLLYLVCAERSLRGSRADAVGMHVLSLSVSSPSLPIQKQLEREDLMQTFLLSKRDKCIL